MYEKFAFVFSCSIARFYDIILCGEGNSFGISADCILSRLTVLVRESLDLVYITHVPTRSYALYSDPCRQFIYQFQNQIYLVNVSRFSMANLIDSGIYAYAN